MPLGDAALVSTVRRVSSGWMLHRPTSLDTLQRVPAPASLRTTTYRPDMTASTSTAFTTELARTTRHLQSQSRKGHDIKRCVPSGGATDSISVNFHSRTQQNLKADASMRGGPPGAFAVPVRGCGSEMRSSIGRITQPSFMQFQQARAVHSCSPLHGAVAGPGGDTEARPGTCGAVGGRTKKGKPCGNLAIDGGPCNLHRTDASQHQPDDNKTGHTMASSSARRSPSAVPSRTQSRGQDSAHVRSIRPRGGGGTSTLDRDINNDDDIESSDNNYFDRVAVDIDDDDDDDDDNDDDDNNNDDDDDDDDDDDPRSVRLPPEPQQSLESMTVGQINITARSLGFTFEPSPTTGRAPIKAEKIAQLRAAFPDEFPMIESSSSPALMENGLTEDEAALFTEVRKITSACLYQP